MSIRTLRIVGEPSYDVILYAIYEIFLLMNGGVILIVGADLKIQNVCVSLIDIHKMCEVAEWSIPSYACHMESCEVLN